MDNGFQFLDIILLAAVAGFIFLRLRSVLGRRMGHEQSPREEKPRRPAEGHKADFGDKPSEDNVVLLGDKTRTTEPSSFSDASLMRTLNDIQRHDKSFNHRTFVEGAQAAYEAIVVAFARGDRDTLKVLLSETVFENFENSITQREDRNETMSTDIVAVHSAEITDATLEGKEAEITVQFEAEMISMTKDEEGVVVAGDPQPHKVNELWTFARNLRSSNPNWLLITTRRAD
ncbi:Tim44/TimA family putative adaptor protein [Sneathiella litorea]|uniref:Tim44/TimA family putative adaptor protein n=1 Tax=Sneathiella litorea TaxID=2606216 RepID=A0A6L8W6C8_9PROT|nr:Tim44/TimA family putative adaptor protein [Sneathiella litorea]MZR29777.1 Tim44/TimA family putative adaptor protein [Sneathiella litorea]